VLRNEVCCQLSDKEEKEKSSLWEPKMSEQCEKKLVTTYLGLLQSYMRIGRKVGGRLDGKGKP